MKLVGCMDDDREVLVDGIVIGRGGDGSRSLNEGLEAHFKTSPQRVGEPRSLKLSQSSFSHLIYRLASRVLISKGILGLLPGAQTVMTTHWLSRDHCRPIIFQGINQVS